MGYTFNIKPPWYKVKEEQEYPWPCQYDENRTILLFTDDVLTKEKDGNYMKHTGLGCFGIILSDDEVIEQNETVKLQML